MNKITLIKQGGAWMAYFKGPHAAQIDRLFGTPVIPTAFTEQADPQAVLEAIRAKNPECEVELGGCAVPFAAVTN